MTISRIDEVVEQERIKTNHKRAQAIVDSWPAWKKEYTITEHSVRDNPYARDKNS